MRIGLRKSSIGLAVAGLLVAVTASCTSSPGSTTIVNRVSNFGCIAIDSNAPVRDFMTSEPQTFAASQLYVADVIADVTIETVPTVDRITVSYTAPAGMHALFTQDMQQTNFGSTLDLGFTCPTTPITIHRPMKIDVQMPDSQPISVFEVGGAVTIGDTRDSLYLEADGSSDITAGDAYMASALVQGSGNIKLGHVGALAATTQGSGNITAESASGELTLRCSGSGEITINNGSADPLTAISEGSGGIVFEGTATTASLSSSGAGSIHVGEVTGPVQQNHTGSGTVTVG